MTVILLVLGALVAGFIRHRRQRARTLNGLNSEVPTFQITPPLRSLTARREHRW